MVLLAVFVNYLCPWEKGRMITGYIAAVVTPFSDGKVDIDPFEKYLSSLDSKI